MIIGFLKSCRGPFSLVCAGSKVAVWILLGGAATALVFTVLGLILGSDALQGFSLLFLGISAMSPLLMILIQSALVLKLTPIRMLPKVRWRILQANFCAYFGLCALTALSVLSAQASLLFDLFEHVLFISTGITVFMLLNLLVNVQLALIVFGLTPILINRVFSPEYSASWFTWAHSYAPITSVIILIVSSALLILWANYRLSTLNLSLSRLRHWLPLTVSNQHHLDIPGTVYSGHGVQRWVKLWVPSPPFLIILAYYYIGYSGEAFTQTNLEAISLVGAAICAFHTPTQISNARFLWLRQPGGKQALFTHWCQLAYTRAALSYFGVLLAVSVLAVNASLSLSDIIFFSVLLVPIIGVTQLLPAWVQLTFKTPGLLPQCLLVIIVISTMLTIPHQSMALLSGLLTVLTGCIHFAIKRRFLTLDWAVLPKALVHKKSLAEL